MTASDPSQETGRGVESCVSAIDRSRVLDARAASAFCGYSRSRWNFLVSIGKAPKGFKVGERKNGWRLGTLLDFIAAREAEAQAPPRSPAPIPGRAPRKRAKRD